MKEERFLDFVDDWRASLKRSSRSNEYLTFVTSKCGFSADDVFSAEALAAMLAKTVEMVSSKPATIEHPVAAFEVIATMDGLTEFASQSFSQRQKLTIETPWTAVSGSVMIFAYEALNRHFKERFSRN